MIITVDAGHGGYDPGAMGWGVMEKTENLLMALTLKFALIEAGHTVYMSRGSDVYPTWAQRTYQRPRSDIFVALHMDSVGGRSAVYYAVKTRIADGQRSALFARDLWTQIQVSDMPCQIYPDTDNRHGRLYIEDTNAVIAVLWETAALHATIPSERLHRAAQFIRAMESYTKKVIT